MNKNDNQQRIIENQNLREIFYSGSNKKGKF